MRKLLWVGDAACESGFARATHFIVPELQKSWDVHVIGINYRGDPHPFRDVVRGQIYPAYVPMGDIFGVRRLLNICDRVHPDLIVLQNDTWNFPAYYRELEKLTDPPPVVGIVAVDGLNCLGRALNKMVRAIFWTEFAREEALRGGCKVPTGVVPLGVDLEVYHPQDRTEARVKMGLPEAAVRGFVFGNVNRNQPRKRLDLTIRYFSQWWELAGRPADAFLYLHVAPTGDQGVDCEQLARYYGIGERLILAEPEMYQGTAEHWVATTYNSLDVLASTTQGEGWGLTTLEGMACGVPCILPAWSALGEWAAPAAWMVPCTSVSVTPRVNCIGGVVDEEQFVRAMDHLYRDADARRVYGQRGLSLAGQPRFRWKNVVAAYAAEIERAWEGCGKLTATEVQPCPAAPA